MGRGRDTSLFDDAAPPEIFTALTPVSPHDALPIFRRPIVDTVAHLRIGTEGQLDVGERGILWSGEYSRDGV